MKKGINTKAGWPNELDKVASTIMEMLSQTYTNQSVTYGRVRHALRKLSLAELDSLYALVATSVVNKEAR